MALLLCDLHMTWQEKDSWLSILGPIHMTGVPQRRQAVELQAGLDFAYSAGLWVTAQLDDLRFKRRTVNKPPLTDREIRTNISSVWQTHIEEWLQNMANIQKRFQLSSVAGSGRYPAL